MANRFFTPEQQFLTNSGVPLVGGFLYFYATGTSTPLNTYSDAALTVANLNPVVLDSNGQAGSVFLQNLAYKVVLADANNQQIWTMDPVYSSDYSTFAQFKPWNGNPNGFVAGTAGTAGALPGSSVVWDYVNNILYVATTTGNAATTVWTAINSSATAPSITTPDGYLTLSTDPSNPILTADVIGSTAVYYTPYTGNQLPVFNGAQFLTPTFTQLTLTLSASQAASTIYDVFVFSNSGVLTLVTGPAWANSATGTGSRGTGGGTSQLQRLNGFWVNAVQISGKNGATTYTIPANTATYVGSIFVDTTPGQVTCHRAWGQSRKWGVWNAYNRQTILLKGGDSTASWGFLTNSTRFANANSANSLITFAGLPEEQTRAQYEMSYIVPPGGDGPNVSIQNSNGIGYNWVSGAASGRIATVRFTTDSGNLINLFSSTEGIASFIAPPSLGINTVAALDQGSGSAAGFNYQGTETNMVLSAEWRG